MDIYKVIQRRHSYRKAFLDAPVLRKDLEMIVDAGIRAPSGHNAQTTRFVVICEPEMLRLVGQMHHMYAMQTAKAMIACIVDKSPEAVYEGYSFAVEDCAAATENMLLMITALGYASVWLDGWLRIKGHAQEVGRLLAVPEDKVVRVLLPIGVPAQTALQQPKKPFSERAWFDRYGG